MGATATDNIDTTLYIYTSVDDGPTIQPGAMVTVDTSEVGTHTITYTVTDKAGNKATATRTVNVEMPQAAAPEPIPEPIPVVESVPEQEPESGLEPQP